MTLKNHKLSFLSIMIHLFILTSCRDKEPKSIMDKVNRKYDIEFEKQLLSLGIDEDKLLNDALRISRPDTIKVLGLFTPISRFDGIEIFTNLERLYIDNIEKTFKSLDLNKNEKLETLIIRVNIEDSCSLKTNNCKKLKNLSLTINGGEIKDFNLQNHQNLMAFNYNYDQSLRGLDLSAFDNLETLVVQKSYLKEFILPNNSNLHLLSLGDTNIPETLDLSSHKKLESLDIKDITYIRKLILPENSIKVLVLHYLQNLESLDLKGFQNLSYLDLRYLPKVQELDLSGSKNIGSMMSVNNVKLTRICLHPEQKKDTVNIGSMGGETKWYKNFWTWWGVCQ